ncbi:5-methylcytosine-specific restriction protein A [Comamonas odontotermitis]|uniref:5-methylcytosine-specific restriction protein A n=1 Tax=Comamonas odontotermitis TaxID=379895 RepID=A0ABR6RFR0_9BURK|nr:HNH endonuclease signature motif containing protein [Comamonas odontotermitis]MBB6577996.1 5-methylcytosine-specific restriction protein A [Comamonas odontotermitis]
MVWSKTSRHARGYGAEWDRLRLQILERDGHLCQCPDCRRAGGQPLPAHEVDHIKPKAWFKSGKAQGNPDDPSNLRSVNRDCHKKLTTLQKGYRPAVRVGVDGYPIEE